MTRSILPLALLAILSACSPLTVQRDDRNLDPNIDDTGTTSLTDDDGDGIGADEDCDDNDPTVGLETLWYLDGDSDGYGQTGNVTWSCDQPDGYVAQGEDCDDNHASIHPGATEVCDNVDQDCDGVVDNSEGNLWYADSDGDSYGDPAWELENGCELSGGDGRWVTDGTDCDDDNADVNPGATEVCNEIDNDCDGTVDENAVDASTWYTDADNDGYGDSTVSQDACDQPSGSVADDTDCNDHDPEVSPGNEEVCDLIDNDCDDDIDEEVMVTYFEDADGDGSGDPASTTEACDQPSGYVDSADDCDDTDATSYPGATEYCDGADNDCDGSTDPDTSADASTWYTDSDSDGYGDATSSTMSCSAPSGTVADATDCDDIDADVNPGAVEVCDDLDDDCDGTTDVGATDAGTYYPDADGDTYGDAGGVTVTQCDQPWGYVADDTDCDDGDATSYPGATEYCDGADNDCDGSTDPDSSSDATTWYTDDDNDGYGDASISTVSCSAPSGTVADGTDCDDDDRTVYPGATEYCDEQDNDCDGDVDEDVGETFYADVDGDGYGDPATSADACDVTSGYVSVMGDCDDTDEYVNPDALEVCGDSVDNDCDEDMDSSPCVTEGDYEGDFTITLTETTFGLGSDSCEGTVNLTVDTTVDPMISGSIECVFSGDFATYLSGTYTGDVEGNFDSDLMPSGSVEISTFGWSFDWDDNGSDDTTVDGNFEGSDSYSILTFDYEGVFTSDYTP
ncbi:hypothetical protein HQ487_03110 [Candidatus Uhrbacteria bacterium]|nr:hypothetical protein [Candidatus Uhrbacteria bacterium]